MVKNGTRKICEGKECIYYDGYWIRFYAIPEDTLANRKLLIDHLTRRTFHHTESGINTPGERLEEARMAYEAQTDPARRRVNGAMLAGALFNRATDIFTAIVELESKGVKVSRDNELMKECASCFKQALELGKQVKHYSGEEGIDELWGEPFKAFTQSTLQVFESRYRKIAQTMRDIDKIGIHLAQALNKKKLFIDAIPLLDRLIESAKLQLETMKLDNAFFTVWPEFIANRETVDAYAPTIGRSSVRQRYQIENGVNLIREGTALITYLSEARVPMPKSMQHFLERCDAFKQEI
ncbi:MAG: hypothetical protein KDI74_14620 [Gammaproteobacteria bacterium]|nr:hypothetical protein [Gammaproteobacteria bacterium]HXK55267.1 hypothetical protein [Gammaproteobacteria bacterium]